ncbi:hypothetical protein MTR_3g082485 [Medicago truncatula]|uniref:Uncharacterized protein n=1 Tax=Medicago truncatula TaxID=3880 RepID=A0A072UZI6_MEDTR|nr:hypothetical protein MTR_3g082485 [Medicago truncatula]
MKVSHALVHTLKEVSIIGGVSLKVVAGCGRWSLEGDGHKAGSKMRKVWKVKLLRSDVGEHDKL